MSLAQNRTLNTYLVGQKTTSEFEYRKFINFLQQCLAITLMKDEMKVFDYEWIERNNIEYRGKLLRRRKWAKPTK